MALDSVLANERTQIRSDPVPGLSVDTLGAFRVEIAVTASESDLRSVGLRWLQYLTQVQPLKVGWVAGSPDMTGEVLISLRWSDFPLQSHEMGIALIKLK